MARRYASAAGLLAVALTSPTFGQTSGQSSFSGLSYSLVDLDLTDAATPSIMFSTPEGLPAPYFFPYAEVEFQETGPQRWESDRHTAFDDNPGMSHTASVIRPLGHGRADGGPGAGASPLGQTLSAAWGSSGSGEYGGSQVSATVEGSLVYFTLAPRTRVTFTASHVVQGDINPATTRHEQLASSAYLGVFKIDESYNEVMNARNYLSIDTLPESTLSIDETEILSVSWDNTSDQPAYGAARMNLWGHSYTASLLPVPEPAPLAMLLGGLLVLRARLGGLALHPTASPRRRSKRTARSMTRRLPERM